MAEDEFTFAPSGNVLRVTRSELHDEFGRNCATNSLGLSVAVAAAVDVAVAVAVVLFLQTLMPMLLPIPMFLHAEWTKRAV